MEEKSPTQPVKNKHGLSRTIPEDIKRTIRKDCGFGCVICGVFLYEYDHIDPLWVDAKVHDPSKMALICPNHHAKKTKGILSTDDVKAAIKNPKAKQQGYSKEEFLYLKRPLKIKLGNWIFNDPNAILKIGGETLLAIEDFEDGSISLSGKFYGKDSNLILNIERNEWQPQTGNWDVEQIGKSLVIREAAYKLSLKISLEKDGSLLFDNIKMRHGDVYIESNQGGGIDIQFKNEPIFTHNPSVKGGIGIETNSFLDISDTGIIAPFVGGTTLGAGTLKFGNPINVVSQKVPLRASPKIGRNDNCNCGSNKKYKNCALKNTDEHRTNMINKISV